MKMPGFLLYFQRFRARGLAQLSSLQLAPSNDAASRVDAERKYNTALTAFKMEPLGVLFSVSLSLSLSCSSFRSPTLSISLGIIRASAFGTLDAAVCIHHAEIRFTGRKLKRRRKVSSTRCAGARQRRLGRAEC